jgi:hypothetical protein
MVDKMKTFYFRNRETITITQRLIYSEWLNENVSKWEWHTPLGFKYRGDSSIGITIEEESDCVAFALKFKCYKIAWNNLNVVDNDSDFYNN